MKMRTRKKKAAKRKKKKKTLDDESASKKGPRTLSIVSSLAAPRAGQRAGGPREGVLVNGRRLDVCYWCAERRGVIFFFFCSLFFTFFDKRKTFAFARAKSEGLTAAAFFFVSFFSLFSTKNKAKKANQKKSTSLFLFVVVSRRYEGGQSCSVSLSLTSNDSSHRAKAVKIKRERKRRFDFYFLSRLVFQAVGRH